MATSYNKGLFVGVLHKQAVALAGGIVELCVKSARYVKDVGESYTEPMTIYVRPYQRGPKKGQGMDVSAFSEGRPIMLEYELLANKKGMATPAANPSSVHLCYPAIQDKQTGGTGRPAPSPAAQEDDDDIPF